MFWSINRYSVSVSGSQSVSRFDEHFDADFDTDADSDTDTENIDEIRMLSEHRTVQLRNPGLIFVKPTSPKLKMGPLTSESGLSGRFNIYGHIPPVREMQVIGDW